MTQSKSRALWSLLIWGGVSISFLVLFFSGTGPETFVQEKARILVTAAMFGTGYLAQLLMLYLTRARPGARPVVRDERDDWIARYANGIAFVVALAYVFVVSIVLWEVYHDRQSVPVGWMWFLAYTSSFSGMLGHAAATLVLNAGVSGHGEG